MQRTGRLRIADYLMVGAFCAILFGYAAFSGRPLTMHEARLPETSREMLQTHHWLLPTSGGRPWLERPPLPHWIVTTSMRLFDHDDRVWVVRLPSGLMGLLTVLLAMWMAGRSFGRDIGIVSGLVLATCFEFYTYACLAEDDIYLAALVAIAAALFFRSGVLPAEQGGDTLPAKRFLWFSFFTWRRPAILGFFVVLGLTNLAKGPLLGLVILGSPIGVFLIWQSITARSAQPLLRYVWLWGWLITIALTIAWPLWAYHKYPDVLENWKYDYLGRMSGAYTDINEPWYYYLPTTLTALLPWTPACLIGLMASVIPQTWVAGLSIRRSQRRGFEPAIRSDTTAPTAEKSDRDTGLRPVRATVEPEKSPSPQFEEGAQGLEARVTTAEQSDHQISDPPARSAIRFILCWAIIPLLVLSIPKGKHHHYLVPLIVPWAILGAIGLREIGNYLFPMRGRTALGVFALLLLIGYSAGQTLIAGATDHTLDDTAFLERVHSEVPADVPLFIDAKLGPKGNLDFFRCQFYSRQDAHLLHNLSFLRDEKITAPVVYVIARARDQATLQRFGTPTLVDQSPVSHDMPGPRGRFTLFRLRFDPKLARYPLPPRITSLQAMERANGPWCGPPL